MQKSGDDGVSREGRDGMDDESIADAMEEHFAPFASAKRSLAEAAAIAGEMDAAHPGDDEDDADPEVTAITRKYEESHDTLGAINELQQLLIERTGQIPIIRVPQPGAEAEPAPEADTEPAPEPETAPEPAAAPEPEAAVEEAAAVETSAPAPAPDSELDEVTPAEPLLDWTLTPIAEPANAPGFSAWVDPEQIAAALDDAPARTYSDVTTQVFSVFAAKPETPSVPDVPDVPEVVTSAPVEPEPIAEPAAPPMIETVPEEPVAEPAPAVPASAPIVTSTESIDITPQLERPELDEDDDVIDDTDRVDRAVHAAPSASAAEVAPQPLTFDKALPAEPVPQPAVREPAQPPAPAAAATPVAPVAPPMESAEPAQKPKRRRWWPFGRR